MQTEQPAFQTMGREAEASHTGAQVRYLARAEALPRRERGGGESVASEQVCGQAYPT